MGKTTRRDTFVWVAQLPARILFDRITLSLAAITSVGVAIVEPRLFWKTNFRKLGAVVLCAAIGKRLSDYLIPVDTSSKPIEAYRPKPAREIEEILHPDKVDESRPAYTLDLDEEQRVTLAEVTEHILDRNIFKLGWHRVRYEKVLRWVHPFRSTEYWLDEKQVVRFRRFVSQHGKTWKLLFERGMNPTNDAWAKDGLMGDAQMQLFAQRTGIPVFQYPEDKPISDYIRERKWRTAVELCIDYDRSSK